jgi:hypothetical protein
VLISDSHFCPAGPSGFGPGALIMDALGQTWTYIS